MEKSIRILLVEDNPADAELEAEILTELETGVELSVVVDGEDAMNFLRRQANHARAPRPNVILLDLNLPRKDGRQVLAELKADPNLKRIPVVVLTSSDAEKDVAEAYDLGANCYLTKSIDLNDFYRVAVAINDFWFNTARLAPE